MSTPSLIIRGRTVVSSDGVGPAAIHIQDEKIIAVRDFADVVAGCEVVEASDNAVVMPGLVDTHVHINSPGRSEWEGFPTATRAAAAGGVTTVIDMPLNSIPPTTTVEALEIKRKAAEGAVYVDTGFWGGAVPDNLDQLRPLHDAGVFGFKCFLL